jgi:hypothetical protein
MGNSESGIEARRAVPGHAVYLVGLHQVRDDVQLLELMGETCLAGGRGREEFEDYDGDRYSDCGGDFEVSGFIRRAWLAT